MIAAIKIAVPGTSQTYKSPRMVSSLPQLFLDQFMQIWYFKFKNPVLPSFANNALNGLTLQIVTIK